MSRRTKPRKRTVRVEECITRLEKTQHDHAWYFTVVCSTVLIVDAMGKMLPPPWGHLTGLALSVATAHKANKIRQAK